MIDPENTKENMAADDFDALLDGALAGYGEPAPGMEERVLAQVRSTRHSRRTWWAAGGVAAAIIVAALLLPLYRSSLHRSAERSETRMPSAAGSRTVPPSLPAVSRAPLTLPSESETPVKASPLRHRRLHVQQVAEHDPGNRVPFPLIVPEDAQERALRVALTRPGFLAALDEASRAAAKSLEEEETQENKANDPPASNTQIDLERK
jgi:hypothetical protein